MSERLRVALVQGVCPHYRVPFFRRLSESCDLKVFYGAGDRQGFYRNAGQVDGFDGERLRTLRLRLRWLHPYLQLDWFPGLHRRLRAQRPQIVVAPGVLGWPSSLTAWAYCRGAGVPFVVWDAGRDVDKPMSRFRRWMEPMSRFLLRRADACLAYSTMAARFFESSDVPRSRIFVAQNTLDVGALEADRERLLAEGSVRAQVRQEQGIASEAVVLLYVGAVERRKRLETLFEAGETLRREGMQVELLVVGDGPHLENLRAEAVRRDVPIRFAGRVVDGVGRLFLASDVFVLPGPGGLSLNQAMAYGLPAVVRGGDGTEIDLLRDDQPGAVVDSVPGLVARLRTLVSDRELREEMGRRSLATIRRFDLDNMARQFHRAFETALSANGTPTTATPSTDVANAGSGTQVPEG